MQRIFFMLSLLLAATACSAPPREDRVATARTEKDSVLRAMFKAKKISYPPSSLFFRVFKSEGDFEVWVRPKAQGSYHLLKTYKICAQSGEPGPKRQEGDLQVPEGFYVVNDFNPQSQFYLSMGINYPNASDRVLGVKGKLGSAIYIHGDCVTLGCMPLTDDAIKEVYWLAWQVHQKEQAKIPVHIFPARLDAKKFAALKKTFSSNPALVSFWENLKEGYDMFETASQLFTVSVDKSGKYLFE